MRTLRTVLAIVMVAAGGLLFGGAAQAFPDKPVKFVVPFAPGGGTDVVARVLGDKMGKLLGQQFVNDNHPGAGGTIGVDYASRQAPDGYSIVLINALNHTAAAYLFDNLKYDPVKSFTAIGEVGKNPYLLIVNPNFPAKTYAEFDKLVRAAPGKYNFASAGIGTSPQLAMELFKRSAGLDIVHVPYKGSGPALNDVVAGVVPMLFENVAAAELIKSGRLRALAITGKQRIDAFPDLPTFGEAGLSNFDVTGYWGVVAPLGVPADIVGILNNALNRTLADPDVSARLKGFGLFPEPSTPQEYAAILQSESAKWARVIKEANIKP